MESKSIALAVIEPIKFTSTKEGDILTVRFDPVGVNQIADIPLSTEAMESLDPLLDAIALGDYLSLEIVKYE